MPYDPGKERGMTSDKDPAQVGLRLFFGLAVMLLGLLLTLDNFGLLEARRIVRFWPVLLIVLGFGKLLHASRHPKARRGAYVLLLLGLGLLLVNLGVFELRLAFSLFLLALSAALVWRAWRSPR